VTIRALPISWLFLTCNTGQSFQGYQPSNCRVRCELKTPWQGQNW